MPISDATHSTDQIGTESQIHPTLRRQAARMSEKLVGHEGKGLMEIKSDTPMASPAHLRQVFKFSGARAPFAVLPTTCDLIVLSAPQTRI